LRKASPNLRREDAGSGFIMKCEIRNDRGERECENEAAWTVEPYPPRGALAKDGDPIVLCSTHLVTFAYEVLQKESNERLEKTGSRSIPSHVAPRELCRSHDWYWSTRKAGYICTRCGMAR
jgi:hypothetical protein